MFESYGYEKIRTSKKVVASHAVAHRSVREGRSLGSCGHRVCIPVVAVSPRQPPTRAPLPRDRAATAGARSGAGPAQAVPTRGEGAGAAEEGLSVCVGCVSASGRGQVAVSVCASFRTARGARARRERYPPPGLLTGGEANTGRRVRTAVPHGGHRSALRSLLSTFLPLRGRPQW